PCRHARLNQIGHELHARTLHYSASPDIARDVRTRARAGLAGTRGLTRSATNSTREPSTTVRRRTSLAMSALERVPALPARAAYPARPRTPPATPPLQCVERSAHDRFELEEELAELDRLRVLDQDRADDAVDVGLHLVHQLHRLENAQRLAGADGLALLHERRRAGLGRAVERPDHRRLDTDEAVRRRQGGRRLGFVERCQGCGLGVLLRRAVVGATHRHTHAGLLDRHLADPGLLDDAHELADAFCTRLVDASGREGLLARGA